MILATFDTKRAIALDIPYSSTSFDRRKCINRGALETFHDGPMANFQGWCLKMPHYTGTTLEVDVWYCNSRSREPSS